MKFIIINRFDEAEFWSNDDGWVDSNSATRFDHSELLTLKLPIHGAWVPDPGIVEESPHYGMFSDEGNEAVHNVLTAFPPTVGESWDDFSARVQYMVMQDGKRQGMNFSEVSDTAVREVIWFSTGGHNAWAYNSQGEEIYVG